MSSVNQNVVSEISVVLVAEPSEFTVERAIINDLICPTLRKYFMSEFQLEFNIIDFYQDCNCKNVPNDVEREELLLRELKKSQTTSCGLSSVILLGDECGDLRAPKKLTTQQFNFVLDFLQSKKDPTWKTFISKYIKSKYSDDYLLDEKTNHEENYSLLTSIDASISSKPTDLFPEVFLNNHLTPVLERCVCAATVDQAAVLTTHVFRRNLNKTYVTESEPKTETPFERKLKNKFDNLIKTTRKKCLPNNFVEYTISNMSLLEAEREVRKRKSKLLDLGETWNFLSPKVRSLSKDIRVSSSADIYLLVFLEHVCKIIRESSINLMFKKDSTLDPLSIESFSHAIKTDKLDNDDLATVLDKERDRERGIFQNYLISNNAKMPGLIYGPVGSGKTTLLLDLVSKIDKKPNMILIVRHCGKTVSSSNLQLLICSISDQINSIITKKCVISNACEYAVCVYDFWMSLSKASLPRPILLFLDDVENLYPNTHTDMVKWLPPSLPNGVKVILTSSSDSFYQGFKKRYEVSNIVNLTKLDPKECIRLLPSLSNRYDRPPIASTILDQASFVVQENSTPLYLNLLSQGLCFVKDPNQLTSETRSILKIYLEQLQVKSNNIIIKHILSYLALSRFGLSLSELSDLLSLDNRILAFLNFNIDAKSVFKFPTFLTVNYLGQCQSILTSIETRGKVLIKLRHQVYISIVIEYFQLSQEEGKFFYQTLFDYWTSKYSGDKLKPTFDKTNDDDDEELPAEGSHLFVKRGISSQPYYSIGKIRNFVGNQRKLLELSGLLIRFEKTSELYRLVIFNFEYLFATLHSFGINHLISELYFTRQINEIKNNTELELLLAQLRLLSPEVIEDARLLAPELSGRLSHLIGTNVLLSQLLRHIDNGGTRINAISAAFPCYSTIDIENMRIDIGGNKELLFSTLSPDNRFISALIKDNNLKDFLITIWDSKSATKSQIINLGKFPNTKFINMFYMPQSDEFVVLQFEETTTNGFFIVNLEFSSVENTIKFPKYVTVRIENLSKSNFYFNVNGDIQVYTHPTGQVDIGLTKMPWPTHLTPNDRYLIGPKPQSNKPCDANKNTFNLRVMNAATGEVVCFLTMVTATSAMLANVRNEFLFLGTKSHGIVYRFDIGQIAKKDAKSLKSNLELRLNEQSNLEGDVKDYITKFYPNVKVVKFQLSVDERFLVAEYIFNDSLRVFGLWNIGTKSLLLCQAVDLFAHVAFSVDGLYFYYIQRNGALNILNLQTNIEHKLVLRDIPEQTFMLRGGSFFIAYAKSIKLTTLKTLLQDYGDEENSQVLLQENFCTMLRNPKLSRENIVVFSNYEQTSTFLYFRLATNSIESVDISHTNESLTEFSTDRLLSPDGGKLLLVFGFKLANLMITDQETDLDLLTIEPGPNGKMINNLNDYRKPKIPRENYFTGRDPSNDKPNKSAYTQKIIKVIDLKTLKAFFQVSLSGEDILKFTDTLLLTFKPDYASLTRKSEDAYDIVSIYDMMAAKFVASIHLEHPVIDSNLRPTDGDQLLICCGSGGRILKLLGGKYFSNVLWEINVQTMLRYYDEFARSSSVTKMFTFEDNNSSVLLQYSWLDGNGVIKVEKETYYAKIETNKKEITCQFVSQGKVSGVSCDGTLAIDSLLNMYDINKGALLRNLLSSIDKADELNNSTYTSLFSRDGNHLVVLDSAKNSIWIIKNDDQYFAIGKALLTSTFQDEMPQDGFKMDLALGGQLVIVYNDREFKIFVVKIAQKSVPYDLNYKTSIERIKKILLP